MFGKKKSAQSAESESLTRCEDCKIEYPSGLVQPIHSNIVEHRKDLCGICALELMNRTHGMRRTQFDGHQAEYIRLQCVAFREKLLQKLTLDK